MSGSQIEIRTSPHSHAADDVVAIMRHVVLALLPILAWSIWQFGLSGLLLAITLVASCLLTERLCNRLADSPSSIGDWSAVITGILLYLTLPPGFPLWMGAVAGVTAIGLGKALFGGLGKNPFNPALVGRAFVQAAFPAAITSWVPARFEGRFSSLVPSTLSPPFLSPEPTAGWAQGVAIDGFTGATPLALQKFQQIQVPLHDLMLGNTAGAAGESPALLILLCGLLLALRRMLDVRIPLAVLAGAAATAGVMFLVDPGRYPDPLFVIFSGGLMLGAWFMATDMVGSPVTPLGSVIFGLLIGFLTVVIRLFGGLTDGVMYAILLANAATPLIDQFTQPKAFGSGAAK